MADEESLSGLSIIYMYLSNYRIYSFITFFFRWKGKSEETTTNQELDDGRKKRIKRIKENEFSIL